MNFSLSLRLVLIPLLLFAVGGCGKKKRETGVVRGKVIFGDKKVGGTVRFVAEDGAVGEGVIYTDGTYEVSEAPVGKCKVAIIVEHLRKKASNIPVAPGPGAGMRGMMGGQGGQSGPPAGAEAGKAAPKGLEAPGGTGRVPNAKYTPIPARYEDPNQSGLTFEVKLGEQEFNITLK